MVKYSSSSRIERNWFDTNHVCLSVDISYKGNRVYLLDKCPRTVTKKNIEEVLKLAEQFDEICEIVKKAPPEY